MRASRGALPSLSAHTLRLSAGSEAQSLRRCWSSIASATSSHSRPLHGRSSRPLSSQRVPVLLPGLHRRGLRKFNEPKSPNRPIPPPFAFAFDIDGVLLHVSKPIPGATETLRYLQLNNIPFILLTNGGGKSEAERVADLSDKLGLELSTDNFVQSHTPFAEFDTLKDKTILVTGSDAGKARRIAHGYGFKSVVTPGDILKAHPEIFPFDPLASFYAAQETLPLPRPVYTPGSGVDRESCLKIDGILVFNDPRDWAVDIQLITDLLLSHQGYLGTRSPHNGAAPPGAAPEGATPSLFLYQNDGQPELWFSNKDLVWSTLYHLPRFGQGAFHLAMRGVWTALTKKPDQSEHGLVRLRASAMGKPETATYLYAQKRLTAHRDALIKHVMGSAMPSPNKLNKKLKSLGTSWQLRTVYMVGDNPKSDIAGANLFNLSETVRCQPQPQDWCPILVRTGVWNEDRDAAVKWTRFEQPRVIVDDVKAALDWVLKEEAQK